MRGQTAELQYIIYDPRLQLYYGTRGYWSPRWRRARRFRYVKYVKQCLLSIYEQGLIPGHLQIIPLFVTIETRHPLSPDELGGEVKLLLRREET